MTETSGEPESKIFRVNNNLSGFSPCGEFIALAYQANVIVKSAGTLETLRLYVFTDIIEYIEWAPSGQYVLCASIKKAQIQVFSINYPDWRWKLTEGSARLECVAWAPDSAHIVTTADLNVQISVWSLETRTVTYIHNLKSACKTLGFSPNGKCLAVIVTDEGNDCVEIYKTDGWKISRKLLCERLNAIDGLSWSPSGELLCIWCSISGQTKLLVYSTTSDSHVGAYSPEASSASVKNQDSTQSVESRQGPRGIDKIAWNPNGQLLAIAAYNETIVLLNYITWKPTLELRCEPVIKETDYLNKVYRECTLDAGIGSANFGQDATRSLEEVTDRPLNIPIAAKGSSSAGVSIAAVDIFEFSACGRYLAVRHEVYSCTVWIWDIAEDSVDHLLLKRPVSGISWCPNSPRLVVFTESPFVFEWWAGRRVACHPSPRGITVLTGQWHPRGTTLALCGYNKTAIMRLGSR